MDKIILTIKDVATLLSWRDQNVNLVRQSAAPFKAIILDFPETKVTINEKEYAAYSGAGEQKMQFCIDQINKLLPKAVKTILTDEVLRVVIQNVFDQVKAYADIQKQKLADKIAADVAKVRESDCTVKRRN